MDNVNFLVLFFGAAIIGNNSFCTRFENAVFSTLGVGMVVYGAAQLLKTAYLHLSA